MADFLLGLAFGVAGVTLIRVAWRLATRRSADLRRDYPDRSSAVMGRASYRGRKRSMYLDIRRNRIGFR